MTSPNHHSDLTAVMSVWHDVAAIIAEQAPDTVLICPVGPMDQLADTAVALAAINAVVYVEAFTAAGQWLFADVIIDGHHHIPQAGE